MIGIDTNVLVRYIVQDDPEQAALATHLIEGQCTADVPGFVNSIVLCELVWVLARAYNYEKSVISAVLQQLFSSAELCVEQPELAWTALREYERGNADFSDYLISQRNHAHGCNTTVTFDRKAANAKFSQLLN